MLKAQYLFRLDDITPTMHWGRFWGLLSVLLKSRVRPLLGLVPDNQDPALDVADERPDFWTVMRQLHSEGLVDIAQHGYQHTLRSRPGLQVIGRRFGIKEMSEFAGDSYASQLSRLDAGQRVLESEQLATPFFMAPNHSFDLNTLRALKTCGFSALSDGIALFPFERAGITLGPQQLWRPLWMPCGVATICLHTNEMGPHEVGAVRAFLRTRPKLTCFAEQARRPASTILRRATNASFTVAYASARSAKLAANSLRAAGQPRLPRGLPERSQQSCI